MEVKKIVMIAVFVLIGFAFLSVVNDAMGRVDTLYTVNNETFAGVNGTEVATAYTPIHSVTNLANASNTTILAADYTVTSTGITVTNGSGTYFVTYLWEDALYNSNTAVQAIAHIVPVLYVLLILVGGGMLLYLTRKD